MSRAGLVELRCAEGRWFRDAEHGVDLHLYFVADQRLVRFCLEFDGELEVEWFEGKPLRTNHLDDSRGPGGMPAARLVTPHAQTSRSAVRRAEEFLLSVQGLDEGLRETLLGIVVAG